MAEYITDKQKNYGWGLSLNMTGKAPAIAKRIFKTLADAQSYADDVNDSAIAGLQLSVISDSDSSKNGIYFVRSIGDGTNPAVLELVGSGTGSIDFTGYAKLTDIDDVKTWVENKNYLTEEVVSDLLPSFINGLEQTGTSVGIKIDSSGENFVSVSDEGLKVSGIEETINNKIEEHYNVYDTTAKIIYLQESEWTALKKQVEDGETSWEYNVIYMVYSND